MTAAIDHARHTPFSDPGRHAALFAELPVDPVALSEVSRNVIVHYRASGHDLPVESRDDINARWLETIVDLDQARHPSPLTDPRTVTDAGPGVLSRPHVVLRRRTPLPRGAGPIAGRLRRLLRRGFPSRPRHRRGVARRALAAVRFRTRGGPTGPAHTDGHRALRGRQHRLRHCRAGVGRLPARVRSTPSRTASIPRFRSSEARASCSTR